MKTIASQLDDAFRAAIQTAFGFEADPLLAASQNDKFGDYQSNAAMGLAKQITERTAHGSTGSPQGKTNPRAVAEQIKANLKLEGIASEVSIAGPGFINVRLAPAWLARQLNEVAADPRLGIDKVPTPLTVVIDYSGPNIAKELHVGHLRSTIIGDACSRVIEFQGHKVIRQNHLGDWGTQFGMLIANFAAGPLDAVNIPDLDKFYKAARKRFDDQPEFAEQARQTVVRLQSGDAEIREKWHRIVDITRGHFQPIYDRLGVRLTRDDERGESSYNALLPDVVADLKRDGIATQSDGATVVFTEGYEAPLIIQKQDGGFGYATTDLAAIRYRIGALHASRVIYFVGMPQTQHFRQVFATAKRAGWASGVLLEHAAFGSVLGEDGKIFTARRGESVKLVALLDEAEHRALQLVEEKSPELPPDQRNAISHAVGMGAVKYSDLSKDRGSDYVFSFDLMLALDGNTAPYMQYAHARVRSIFRKAKERGVSYGGIIASPIMLDAPQEIALAKQLLQFSDAVQSVSRELKPHILCAYLYELAGRYSSFYESCPVLQSEEPLRSSRLSLADVTARTLALGLDLLGIAHPDQM